APTRRSTRRSSSSSPRSSWPRATASPVTGSTSCATAAPSRPPSRAARERAGRSEPAGAGGGPPGGGPLLRDDLQAAVPEAGVGEIEAHDRAELLRRARAPAGEQLEVLRYELGAALLVGPVDRQRQQLPVRVGVDVPGRAHEVRDVRPPGAVALGDLH